MKYALTILFCFMISLFIGCSMILPGSIYFHNKNLPGSISINNIKDIYDIDRYDKIRITYRNGIIEEGYFLSLNELSKDEYTKIYEDFLNQNQLKNFPHIGEDITIVTNDQYKHTKKFFGFDIGGIVVLSNKDKPKKININTINSISEDLKIDKILDSSSLDSVSIPVYTSILYRKNSNSLNLCLHNIKYLEVVYDHMPIKRFFITGLIIDVLGVYGLMQAMAASELS